MSSDTIEITRSVSRSGQNWTLTGIYLQGAHRLRVRIRRNAYDTQSYALVEAWSPTDLRWNQIHALSLSDMRVLGKISNGQQPVPLVSYAQERLSRAGEEAFEADERELLLVADAVLFPANIPRRA